MNDVLQEFDISNVDERFFFTQFTVNNTVFTRI
jgi:hypothetical protein